MSSELATVDRSKTAILLLGNFLSGSGGSRGVCEELAERLPSLGWLRVLTASDKPAKLARLVHMASTTWRQRNEYAAAKVSVFSGPAFLWAEVTCQILRRLGKPFILSLHGGDLPTFARQWPRRVRRLLQSADLVTAPSHYLLEAMRDYRADILLLPNAIELRHYPFRLRAPAQPRLVWLRTFHFIYNPEMALVVLANLRRDFPSVHLTMVGPDKGDGCLQSFQMTARLMGVDERVQLAGGVPKADVPEWLNRGDIFLNTTNSDNTPVSVIEAMACGLCVVSTNAGGVPHLLNHDQDALLVRIADAAAMSGAVRRVLTERELAERLSRNARRKIEPFDWGNILPQWEALFKRLVAGANLKTGSVAA